MNNRERRIVDPNQPLHAERIQRVIDTAIRVRKAVARAGYRVTFEAAKTIAGLNRKQPRIRF